MDHSDDVKTRRARVEELRRRADDVLNSHLHSSVKIDAAEALRDLQEAGTWLDRALVDGPQKTQAVLGFADYRIQLAAMRLDFIDDVVRQYGENVEFLR